MRKILFFLLALSAVAEAVDRPNLIVIQTDEHNFRTLGCYRKLLSPEQALMWGKHVVETPHIDSLCDRGVICTSFYATTPVCSPSRGSFVSGLYPQSTNVVTNNIPMGDHVITFAQILKEAGYATGYVGKWHLDGGGKPQWAPERKFGFDDNRYMFNRGHWKQFEDTPVGPRVKSRSAKGKPDYGVKGADEESFATDWLMRKVEGFVGVNRDKPFCLMTVLPDPHGPDTVRAPYDTMYADLEFEKPRTYSVGKRDREVPHWGIGDAKFQNMANYYGMVKCIDDNIGKLLAKLEEWQLRDNTIIVFTSDHGDLRGEHNRQNKGVPYEGSARIPFIVSYPAKYPKPVVVDEALTCVDFLPSILKVMGVETTGKEEGRDASQLLLTGEASQGWKDVAFMRATNNGWICATSDQHKLVIDPIGRPWLFDLKRDPDELINFFTDKNYREVVRDLAKELLTYGKTYSDPVIAFKPIKADLDWAISGEGKFEMTERMKKKVPGRIQRKKNDA
ncbi:MAG: arylsulfatase A-like enzyme [Verrucomicrobiales bacterium]|jgi:arylsulfatase A-like enzyme